ncbi:MAG: glycoside hydrolase family protein [Chloroflexota bacterium]
MTLREQLRRDEGFRLKPYRDTVGKLTIGVGRNLDDKGLTADEVWMLLEHDIDDVQQALGRFEWFLRLDAARQGVCLNMAFNLGVAGFLEFRRMQAALEAQDWEQAAAEMLDSRWASQVGARATRLAQQMRTGQWT